MTEVWYLDHMGYDHSIAAAARISYQEGTKQIRSDVPLIRYLLRNQHMSPFEMCEMKVRVKCPIFVARQIMRHRTFNFNEVSGRYSILPEEVWIPHTLRVQSKSNKQGSEGQMQNREKEQELLKRWETIINDVRNLYDDMLENDVAREVARAVLPLGQYTEIIMKNDLRNWLHFCKLRIDSHAQYEVRVIALQCYNLLKHFFPITCQAWEHYEKNSIKFSVPDQEHINITLDLNWEAKTREEKELVEKVKEISLNKIEKNVIT